MSIYPVYLCSWFPVNPKAKEYSKYETVEQRKSLSSTAKMIVQTSECVACSGKCTWKKAWGHHSIPWGNGDVWCSKSCLLRRKKTNGKTKKS